ncbi:MAG: hypothetical protein SPL35_08235 [Bacteroidales bacterium]|nr:hypothetical protein [Bacteroidales bacterium]
MKRYLIILVALAVFTVSCGPKKTKVYDGSFIKTERGVLLPIADAPGEKASNYDIEVEFGDKELILKSSRMLGSCYASFLYELPGGNRDVMDVDLDFQDLVKGKYMYSISYGWLPGKNLVKKMVGVTFFYAPLDTALPTVEEKDENGTVAFSYPDFTGYRFMFQGEEVEKYLSPLLEKLM